MEIYNINYSINHFTIEFTEKMTLGENKHSYIRGIIGQSLMKNNCISDCHCENCAGKNSCIVARFLEMKLKVDIGFSVAEYIPPFIIICDDNKSQYLKGDKLLFSIVFFADSIYLLPEIIRAISSINKFKDLYKNNINLVTVINDKKEEIYANGNLKLSRVKIRTVNEYIENRLAISEEVSYMKIINPVRYKVKGKFVEDIDEEQLFNLLKRRIITLNALQGNKVEINTKCNLIFKEKNIQWSERKRYSNKQKSSMLLGGLVGGIELEALDLENKKMLIAGELIHIGKNTSFGLGDYIIY